MAKTSGLGLTALSVDDSAGTARDVRNDVSDFQMSTPRAVQDVTGLDKSAMERLLLLADFSITLNVVGFNDAANTGAHTVLKTIPSNSAQRTVTVTITGGVGTNTLATECLFTDYAITRGSDGALTATAPGVLANGAVPTWA
jgi:hypothetical protein